ncbi:MAG: acyl carrier protein [Pseudomonadota bacterium]
MMEAKHIEQQLRGYILENLLFTKDQSVLKNETSLLESGVVDSTGILEVIMFLENHFGIKVEDEEMIPENLDSINSIVSYVQRKRAA